LSLLIIIWLLKLSHLMFEFAKNKDKIQSNPKIKKFLAIIKNGDLILRTDGSITSCTVFTLYLYSGYNLTL
ncbi:hypothetical protein, partial [Acinetobacter baumannii]